MKKVFIGTFCLVLIYSFANAKEGNNSRIQQLEAQVAEMQNQINDQNVATVSASGDSEVVFELCNLFVLTGNTPPLFCRDCGNGNIELLEECDDGNAVGGDGCSADCLWEECGNGILDINEECDDGNINDGDGCSFSCTVEFKRVFLTSTAYSGDLGGLDGADAICNDLATEVGLSGTYKAWLSDSFTSVSERFTHTGPYILVDGTPVADNWVDLTDGYLSNQINRDEKNTYYASQQIVWTNTLPSGEIKNNYFAYNCNDWTTTSYLGGTGSTYYPHFYWTNRNVTSTCSFPQRLYCFEQ
jgi:cysteine-rich repeat protein